MLLVQVVLVSFNNGRVVKIIIAVFGVEFFGAVVVVVVFFFVVVVCERGGGPNLETRRFVPRGFLSEAVDVVKVA